MTSLVNKKQMDGDDMELFTKITNSVYLRSLTQINELFSEKVHNLIF